jgi:GLPGLI family protein
MKTFLIKLSILLLILLAPVSIIAQEFQGKAYYSSKTTMDMSRFNRGGQMSEQQKKQMEERMKPFLEKTFVLTFNKEESMFKEDEKLEAPSSGGGGRGFGFMSSFSSGPQYKNVKNKIFIQDQEFFGKQFLIKEELTPYKWKMGSETKQIGKYTAFKATVMVPADEMNWMRVEPSRRSNDNEVAENDNNEVAIDEPEMIEVMAWYTPMVPVNQGPGEYWGLPGLILELSAGDTIMLCSKIVMNSDDKEAIKMPEKGKEVTKKEYTTIITEKMEEMRNNRGRGRTR